MENSWRRRLIRSSLIPPPPQEECQKSSFLVVPSSGSNTNVWREKKTDIWAYCKFVMSSLTCNPFRYPCPKTKNLIKNCCKNTGIHFFPSQTLLPKPTGLFEWILIGTRDRNFDTFLENHRRWSPKVCFLFFRWFFNQKIVSNHHKAGS